MQFRNFTILRVGDIDCAMDLTVTSLRVTLLVEFSTTQTWESLRSLKRKGHKLTSIFRNSLSPVSRLSGDARVAVHREPAVIKRHVVLFVRVLLRFVLLYITRMVWCVACCFVLTFE